MREIYFDHNATFPIYPEVKNTIMDIMSMPLNSSSIHSYGRHAKNILEKSRNTIKNFIQAGSNYNLIFTSSGTEANNLALNNFDNYKKISSCIEHPSVLKVIGKGGIIPVDSNGVVILPELEAILKNLNAKTLVSIMYANNETGVIQPMEEISHIVHKYDCLIHTDAVQAVGKLGINLSRLDIDLMTISGHKFGGPVGIGCLVYKKNLNLKPMLLGGGQEHRLRSGTQNIAAISGFAKACEIALSKYNAVYIESIRDYIEKSVKNIDNNAIIFSKNAPRLSNTLSIGMMGMSAETQVIYFDINGIALSAGSACSSGRVDVPYVQKSMGYEDADADSAIRISLGPSNNMSEADKFIKLWGELKNKSSTKN